MHIIAHLEIRHAPTLMNICQPCIYADMEYPHRDIFASQCRQQRGACSGMWPATKCVGPWLFPLRKHRVVKPAIAWLGCPAKGWCHGDCKEDVAGKG